MEYSQSTIVIYIHTVLSYIVLYIVCVSITPIEHGEKVRTISEFFVVSCFPCRYLLPNQNHHLDTFGQNQLQ